MLGTVWFQASDIHLPYLLQSLLVFSYFVRLRITLSRMRRRLNEERLLLWDVHVDRLECDPAFSKKCPTERASQSVP